MKLTITRQENYSRGQLLLRSFFGFIYMLVPHAFIMLFCNMWASILAFISWWVILFTGRYPQSFFDFQVKMLRWSIRLNARWRNLVDGYPAFMPSGTDDLTQLDVTYPESLSRGTLLLRAFFGWLYILIPHGFLLFFRAIWGAILAFIAWWAVLFTGRYPESMHAFQVETIRWGTRVNLYMANMTDFYPPFHGRE
jgi:hypothetical protein